MKNSHGPAKINEQEIVSQATEQVVSQEQEPTVVEQTVPETTSLFAQNTSVSTGVHKLNATVALQNITDAKAHDVISVSSKDASLKELVIKSFTDAGAQDELLNMYLLDNEIETDVQVLNDESDNDLIKLLKSQQSKRTRAKHANGLMTVAEYLKLMSSAYAERLIRTRMGKPKNVRSSTALSLTDDDLNLLKQDEEALRKKIRSLQSKTCLLKQRADFKTESQQAIYNETLEQIERLKVLRPNTTSGTKVVKDDPKLAGVREMLKGINPDEMTDDAQRELLAEIMGKLA